MRAWIATAALLLVSIHPLDQQHLADTDARVHCLATVAPEPCEIRYARIIRVIDADSFVAEFCVQERIRLANADAWESHKTNRSGFPVTEEELALGQQAKHAVSNMLLNEQVVIEVRPPGSRDNFGRILGRVYFDGRDLADYLEAHGWIRQPPE